MPAAAVSDPLPRWNDQISINYMRDRLGDEDGRRKSRSERRNESRRKSRSESRSKNGSESRRVASRKLLRASVGHSSEIYADVALCAALMGLVTRDPPGAQRAYDILRPPKDEPTRARSQQAYRILRRLPGYSLGDPLRPSEKVLCCSKDATLYAMDRLRPNDCAFLRRSDGSFTYALFEGPAKAKGGDASEMSFVLDGEGHYKRVPANIFCSYVKVPVLLGRVAGEEEGGSDRANAGQRRRNRRASLDSPVSRSQQTSRRHRAYPSTRRISLATEPNF